MISPIEALILAMTTCYQTIACWLEDQPHPPGQLIDVGGHRLHLVTRGTGSPTVIVDHSLGGVEGYLLISELAKLTRVCIYDRAGYGWSDPRFNRRTSQQIVGELNLLLEQANIEPPYILLGDSFGSYNLRLYAHQFPSKVVGLILTDGLHESGMLKMSLTLQALKLFFASGFVMSVLGAALGFTRILQVLGTFELLKPELKQFTAEELNPIKRSFCRPKHWLTMTQEILDLDSSSQQLIAANHFGNLPIINIKAAAFFKPAFWNFVLPLKAADKLRDQMHTQLLTLSNDCVQLQADRSGHFVWADQPEVMTEAVRIMLQKVSNWHDRPGI